jgi:hypothetical protein
MVPSVQPVYPSPTTIPLNVKTEALPKTAAEMASLIAAVSIKGIFMIPSTEVEPGTKFTYVDDKVPSDIKFRPTGCIMCAKVMGHFDSAIKHVAAKHKDL